MWRGGFGAGRVGVVVVEEEEAGRTEGEGAGLDVVLEVLAARMDCRMLRSEVREGTGPRYCSHKVTARRHSDAVGDAGDSLYLARWECE